MPEIRRTLHAFFMAGWQTLLACDRSSPAPERHGYMLSLVGAGLVLCVSHPLSDE